MSKAALAFIIINLQTIAVMLIGYNLGGDYGWVFFVGCAIADLVYFMISNLFGEKK